MSGRFVPRFRMPFRRKPLDADMAEEMRLHLEMQEEANRQAGMSAEDAHCAARRQFGGVALGIVCAVAATRLLTSLPFGVAPLNAAAFIAAPVAVTVVTLLACLWPILHAARIDPSEALRTE